MKEEWNNRTTFEYPKNYELLVRTTNLSLGDVCCAIWYVQTSLLCSYSFSGSTIHVDGVTVHRPRHSSNTTKPTMIHGHAFRIMT